MIGYVRNVVLLNVTEASIWQHKYGYNQKSHIQVAFLMTMK